MNPLFRLKTVLCSCGRLKILQRLQHVARAPARASRRGCPCAHVSFFILLPIFPASQHATCTRSYLAYNPSIRDLDWSLKCLGEETDSPPIDLHLRNE